MTTLDFSLYAFSDLLLLFVSTRLLSFVLFIGSSSLCHFPSCPHLQYMHDLEEEERRLCIHFLQKKTFRAWLDVVREAKKEAEHQYKTAAKHSDR